MKNPGIASAALEEFGFELNVKIELRAQASAGLLPNFIKSLVKPAGSFAIQKTGLDIGNHGSAVDLLKPILGIVNNARFERRHFSHMKSQHVFSYYLEQSSCAGRKAIHPAGICPID